MKKLLTIFATFVMLCAVGCEEQGGGDDVNPNDKTEQPNEKPDDDGKEDVIPEDAYIALNKEVVTFSPDGESIEVKVYSNYEWKLTTTCDWITPSVTGGEASEDGQVVTISAAQAYDNREGTIIFSCGKAKKLLVVSQSLKETIIADENNTFSVPAEGGNVILNYKTTVECEVVIPDEAKSWITLSTIDTTRGLMAESIKLDVAENSMNRRSAVIKIISKYNSSLFAEYIIYQCPAYAILYTSTDGEIVTPYASYAFGASIVSNTYENGLGVIEFDGPVTSIGYLAFQNCKSLNSITIPNSVTSIGKWAFHNCRSIAEFKGKFASKDGKCLIVDGIFKKFAVDCGLTTYTIPDGVTQIEEWAFDACKSLTSITIPYSVTEIGDDAFANCWSLAEFSGKFASNDKKCLIVDGVLKKFAVDCGLTEYTIPDGVTEIGDNAFWQCKSLINITIPHCVTSIGEEAFYLCTSLTSVTIPDSVTSIENAAFAYCSSLTNFQGKFASDDGRCLIVEGVLNSFAPAGLTEYTIPDRVTSIGEVAFYRCTSQTSITIPDSVTSIGTYAFYGCI